MKKTYKTIYLLILVGMCSLYAQLSELETYGYSDTASTVREMYDRVAERTNITGTVILIDGILQNLFLVTKSNQTVTILKQYKISTAEKGFDNTADSSRTPTGIFQIKDKMGENAKVGTVFEKGKMTEKIVPVTSEKGATNKRVITTRMLTLDGLESDNKNTYSRKISIHGIANEGDIGTRISSGNILVKNNDIVELFDLVNQGALVFIKGASKEIPAVTDTRAFTEVIPEIKKAYETIFLNNPIGTNWAIIAVGNRQRLYLIRKLQTDYEIVEYIMSSSKYKYSVIPDSNGTPLGLHRIKEMVGSNAVSGTVFKAKKDSGVVGKILTDKSYNPDRAVTTRIMHLEGTTEENKTSYNRFIYIHGTVMEGSIGTPQSHGCLMMKNNDIIELFTRVQKGTYVAILKSLLL